MTTKADFTELEWQTLQRGLTGAGMLVSMSDPDFTDTFGESSALAKYLTGQRSAGATGLMRELGGTRGTGFGMTSKPDEVRSGTIAALHSSIETLAVKAPEEVDPYRQLVLGAAVAVAEAKSGVMPVEVTAIDAIREALGVA